MRPASFLLALALCLSAWALFMVLSPPPLLHPEATLGLLARLDLDGDGRLDRSELSGYASPGISAGGYDLDADGFVDAYELEVFLLAVDPVPLGYLAFTNPADPR